jgi:hypothetical protein
MASPDNQDCVEWTGAVNNKGYGVAHVGVTTTTAHRAVWFAVYGPIPGGFQIDHLCRNRLCINIDHLELVTPRENTRRAPWTQVTECPHGHPLNGDNLHIQIVNGWPKRSCRACRKARAS